MKTYTINSQGHEVSPEGKVDKNWAKDVSEVIDSQSGTNTGDVTLGTAGSTPAAAGASLSGQVLTLQPADGTYSGVLSVTTQTIAGVKTFSTGVVSSTYVKLVPTADPPGTPAAGMLYADTDHKLYFYNGTDWKEVAFV